MNVSILHDYNIVYGLADNVNDKMDAHKMLTYNH